MDFATVYDPLYSLGSSIVTGLLVALVFGLWVVRPGLFLRRGWGLSQRGHVLISVAVGALLFGLAVSLLSDLVVQRRRFEAGDYAVAEGVVRGFVPVGDHRPARFDLGDAHFTFYGSLGVPVTEGLRLRILHRGDLILRVEAPVLPRP